MSEHIFSYAVVQNLEVINYLNLLISSDDYICKETWMWLFSQSLTDEYCMQRDLMQVLLNEMFYNMNLKLTFNEIFFFFHSEHTKFFIVNINEQIHK